MQRLQRSQNKLRDLGWPREKLRFEHRWFLAGSQQSSELAKELVRLRPDVVVVNSTPLLAALESQSRTIPIVFVRAAIQSVSSRPKPGSTGWKCERFYKF